MDEQFDDILKNRIREVFENFDNSSADDGWLKLREKFPEEQSKRRAFAWFWWGSVAALLLMCLGIGLWVNNYEQIKPEKLTGKKIKTTQHQNPAIIEDHNTENTLASAISKNSNKVNSGNTPATNSTILPKPKTASRTGSAETFVSVDQALKKPPVFIKTTDSNNIADNKIADKLPILTTHPNPLNTNPVVNKPLPAKSLNSMFAQDKAEKTPGDEKTSPNTKKVRFTIYAATYFNYAKGSDNQVNIGAGFSTDIKISKNLKLVTGVAIGQNTLNYAGTGTPAVILASASRPVLREAATYANTLALAAVSPVFKSYNASLVGLDIPVNLKYEFNPQKSDTYFSAGLSSGTFINESYTYHYTDPLNTSLAPPNTTSSQAFNSFYFARTLNLALGIGTPFGKTNRLIIEPFLKYPLQGLGSQDIRFGAGGINLKLNLSSKK